MRADQAESDGAGGRDPASLAVLLVGYPLAPVGPDAVGGAEQILALIDEALAAQGHRSFVVAPEGSMCRGKLLATPLPRGPFDDAAKRRAQRWHRAMIARALRDLPIDLVHLHGVDFDRYLPDPGPPVLATLHLPVSFYPPSVFRLERPATFLHGVSASQSATFPEDAFVLPEIPNGIALDRCRFGARKHGFAIALGRICPEKGYHLALEAATRASVPLFLAGSVYPYEAHERYFREAIAPRLGDGHRFVGPIGSARKRHLLSGARCLLVPSLVAETSSLVAMEALASGTPVIAFRRGALPEIVEHGVTGFLVDGVDEMADAIAATETIDPLACRRAAEERFSAERMTQAYVETYAGVIRAARCASSIASTIEPQGRRAAG
ncbi:MAG: glycosyltransferase family 4 protein [Minicystis sp.]